jgi:hypothetical protein
MMRMKLVGQLSDLRHFRLVDVSNMFVMILDSLLSFLTKKNDFFFFHEVVELKAGAVFLTKKQHNFFFLGLKALLLLLLRLWSMVLGTFLLKKSR